MGTVVRTTSFFTALLLLTTACLGSENELGEELITTETSSSNQCPDDSIFLNGKCECDLTLCKHFPCNENLFVISNGTETPGECCPVYNCGFCSEESIHAGTCMCAVGALLSPKGSCECVDQDKILVDGECVCDESKCPTAEICDSRSVQLEEHRGCCTHVECKACPPDSYPHRYHDDELEDTCVCHVCSKPEKDCPANTTLSVVKRGNNFPGSCCDLYDCVNVSCEINGVTYGDGETSFSGEDECVCQKGTNICKPRKVFRDCSYSGSIYIHGQKWSEDDCTECTCEDGNAKCIAHFCESGVVEIPAPECPSMAHCTKFCMCGYKTNKNGCEYCKCNRISSCDQLSKMLLDKNMTEAQVVDIIDKYLKIDHNTIADISKSNDFYPEVQPEKLDKDYNDCLPFVFIVILIATASFLLILFAVFLVKRKIICKMLQNGCERWPKKDQKNWQEKTPLK